MSVPNLTDFLYFKVHFIYSTFIKSDSPVEMKLSESKIKIMRAQSAYSLYAVIQVSQSSEIPR